MAITDAATTTRMTKVTSMFSSPRMIRMNKKSNSLLAVEATSKSQGIKAEVMP